MPYVTTKDKLDLRNAVHIGHSTGGGEVARYVAKHGQPAGRAAEAVLVSAVPPLMVKTDANPESLPIEVFDGFRKALADNWFIAVSGTLQNSYPRGVVHDRFRPWTSDIN